MADLRAISRFSVIIPRTLIIQASASRHFSWFDFEHLHTTLKAFVSRLLLLLSR